MNATTWTYKQTEPTIWTVGCYTPDGWEPESDHGSSAEAAERIRWLNGGAPADADDSATTADLRRELEKAREALTGCELHLARHAEANAALHCSERVMYSPLYAKVQSAINGIDHAVMRTGGDDRD